ncbi:MAG: hypothetical protein LBI42_08185 [Chitinispirillales bacterium]|jgi:hypothetical protein|nr:hypothetical protein [Chitinispirillales bacterium]
MNAGNEAAPRGRPPARDSARAHSVPDWKLELYLLGELSDEELKLDEGTLRERIAALRDSDAKILETHPPAWMAGRIERARAGKLASAEKKNRRLIRLFAIPAAACAALLVLFPVGMQSFEFAFKHPAAPRYEDRVKGAVSVEPAIEVWRKEGDMARKLAPLSDAREGDVVQVLYTVHSFCYGAIVSMDGRGVLTVHLAGESGKASPLAPGGPVALDMSYQLDDAPLYEIFYLITSSENFDLDSVTQPLKKADHPVDRWDESFRTKITTFTLNKT